MAEDLKQHNISAVAISANQIRFVTHLDISEEMVGKVIDVIGKL
jgi:threonine aldolase